MFSIRKCAVPANTMLDGYFRRNGVYTDCYTTDVPGNVPFPDFIFAFYTTWLIKLERLILTFTVFRPSTDVQVRQLADGKTTKFAAWYVEGRDESQILMCDFTVATRSWLAVVPSVNGTQLYFGSAVVAVPNSPLEAPSLGLFVPFFIGLHRIYSRLLLYFAALRIQSGPSTGASLLKKENS
jgi:hypothetical protein